MLYAVGKCFLSRSRPNSIRFLEVNINNMLINHVFSGKSLKAKVLASLTIFSLLAPSLVLPNTAQAATTIFSDDFSGDFSAWTSVDANPGWEASNNQAKTHGNVSNNDRSLTKTLSSVGYEDINLSFQYRIPQSGNIEGNDHIFVEWSANGTVWNVIVDYTNSNTETNNLSESYCNNGTDNDDDGLIDWADPQCGAVSQSFDLPTGAENQAALQIRFRTSSVESQGNADQFQLDNVVVTGEVLPPAPTEDSLVLCTDDQDNDDDDLTDFADPDCAPFNTAPVITLIGASPTSTPQNSTYTDEGATANDAEDGSLSPTVSSNTVNTAVLGTYEVVYSVTDSGSLTDYATRTVEVVEVVEEVPDLSTGTAFIQGRKYRDVNSNGKFDVDVTEKNAPGDVNRLNGWSISLYTTNWILLDTALTGSNAGDAHTDIDYVSGSVEKGQYRFGNLAAGTYNVCEALQEGWDQTSPSATVTDIDLAGVASISSVVDPNAEGQYCYQVTLTEGQQQAYVRFGNLEESNEEPTFLKVKIYKYLDGVQANAESAGGHQFPMHASWSDLINSGEGDYVLGNSHGSADQVYGAFTREMSVPTASYATNEITSEESGLVLPIGAECAADKYRLVGYTTGDSLAEAEAGEPVSDSPSFTDISADKYVIVWNEDCDTVLSAPDNSISGYKWHDANADGNWDPENDEAEEGLDGWTITLAKKINGPLEVSALGTDTLTPVLEDVKDYFLNAFGTFDAADSITADAQHSVRAPNDEWTDSVQNYEGWGPTLLDLQINDVSVDWGNYTDTHSYWLPVDGAGSALAMSIYDIAPENNTGNLDVNVYEVIDTTVTDENGYYEFADLELGDYIVRETNKPGWVQTYPEGDGTNYVTLTVEQDSVSDVNFGNDQDVEVEEGEACGYKFHDVNTNGVWDEGEPALAGITMELYEMNGNEVDTTRTDVTDEDGRFCFAIANAPGDNILGEEDNGWSVSVGLPQTLDVEDTSASYEFADVGNYQPSNEDPQDEPEEEEDEDEGGGGSSGSCPSCNDDNDDEQGGGDGNDGNNPPVDNGGDQPGFGQGGAEGGLALGGPADDDGGADLGDGATTTATTTDGIASTTDDNTNQLAAVGALGGLFGISWWWWILILILLGIIGYYTFRDKENN